MKEGDLRNRLTLNQHAIPTFADLSRLINELKWAASRYSTSANDLSDLRTASSVTASPLYFSQVCYCRVSTITWSCAPGCAP